MTGKAPLSVRLDDELGRRLDRHCAQTGATRSQVVKQSLAQYLVSESGPTLSSLAEAVLPAPAKPTGVRRGRRQKRFRAYVRAKRRR